MPVMLLYHPGIGMPELRCNHRKGYAAHCEPAGVGVAERVKVRGWVESCRSAGSRKWALLLGFAPRLPVLPHEQTRTACTARCEPGEELASLVRQHDVTRLAGLADSHADSSSIDIEVVRDHRGYLTITAAGEQRACNQHAEIPWAGIGQPPGFFVGKIAQPRGISLTKRERSAMRR